MKKFIITAVMAILFGGFALTANAQTGKDDVSTSKAKDDTKKYEPTLVAFEQCLTSYKEKEKKLADLEAQAQDPSAKNSVSNEIKALSKEMTALLDDAVKYRDGKKGKPALVREKLSKDQTRRYDNTCEDLRKLLIK